MKIVRLLIQTIAHVRRRKQSQMRVEPRETVLNLKRSCYVAAALLSASSPTFANELSGTWLRDTGEARVKFESCGDAMCGTIIWLKPGIDSKAKIGQRVFYDMKPAGPNAWSGKAFGPDTGSVISRQTVRPWLQSQQFGLHCRWNDLQIDELDESALTLPNGPIRRETSRDQGRLQECLSRPKNKCSRPSPN
jgi:hypothetical protein